MLQFMGFSYIAHTGSLYFQLIKRRTIQQKLPNDPASHLNNTGICCVGHLTEGLVASIAVGKSKVRMVKDIEELATQLQTQPRSKWYELGDIHVRVVRPRSEENAPCRSSEISWGRCGEAGSVKVDESIRPEMAAEVAVLPVAQAICANLCKGRSGIIWRCHRECRALRECRDIADPPAPQEQIGDTWHIAAEHVTAPEWQFVDRGDYELLWYVVRYWALVATTAGSNLTHRGGCSFPGITESF